MFNLNREQLIGLVRTSLGQKKEELEGGDRSTPTPPFSRASLVAGLLSKKVVQIDVAMPCGFSGCSTLVSMLSLLKGIASNGNLGTTDKVGVGREEVKPVILVIEKVTCRWEDRG